MDSARALIAADQGGVVVMVALTLPVLVLFAAFVIDIGNWFVHDRHLQTQADAAALAGGVELATQFMSGNCDDAVVENAARDYSGDEADDFNPQVGTTSPDDVHFVLNSANYHENSGPVDTTVVQLPPCEAGMVDVKMSETDLPLFLQVAGLVSDVDYINTHARVQLFQKDRFGNGMPVGVPDPNPKVGRVIFVDETTTPATVLGSRPLLRNGTSNEVAIWDNSTDPFPLTVNSSRIGVRVALGGATSTTCGDPLVTCYDAGGDDGILHIRGYSNDGSGAQPNAPLARGVTLTSGTCADPYFVDNEAACTIGVEAEVDFGPCDTLGGVAPELVAQSSSSNTDYPLTLTSCPSGSSTGVWETAGAPISVDVDDGPVEITLDWEETGGTQGGRQCNDKGGNPCKGSFGPVQRIFSASEERTGPIRAAQVTRDGSSANSLEACSAVTPACAYDVVATIGVELNLSENAASVDDEPVALRFGADAGSQNQALDCDPAVGSLREEIANGCGPEYTINQGTACPDPNALALLPQPWDCVEVETGDKTGQIWQGMNLRVHDSESPTTCVSENNWADFPNFDHADPRIVSVFVTPFGSFSGSGGGTVPVTNFATFYVTGWHGSQTLCPTDDLAPDKSIIGHFIKYVQVLNDGSAGEESCVFDDLASCVAVMTE